jgi:probable HAF family extracellular repeat protein
MSVFTRWTRIATSVFAVLVLINNPAHSPVNAAVASSSATLVDMGTLGGSYAEVLAINNIGQAVGQSTTSSGQHHAFLWQNSSMSDLGTLGGSTSVAYSINDDGQAVGYAFTSAGKAHAALWQDGTVTDLNTLLGADESYAHDINNAGVIVGTKRIGGSYQAFLINGNQVTSLGTGTAYALNDNNVVVGTNGNGTFGHAFRWQGGANTDLGTLPGDTVSAAFDINNAGSITGFSGTSYGFHAFRWANGSMTDLGTLGGLSSFAYSINEYDQIVGGSVVTAEFDYDAFLWQSNSMTDLGFEGAVYTEARSINETGQIGLNRTDADNPVTIRHALLMTVATPTPTIEDLMSRIQSELIDTGALTKGQGNALLQSLKKATSYVQADDNTSACRQLDVFGRQASAFKNGGHITEDEYASLIDANNSIKADLCP